MAKPKNLEQLRAEKEQVETQLAQEQHKLERLENRKKYLEKGERQKRTHRLCNLGGTIESLAPEVKDLTRTERKQIEAAIARANRTDKKDVYKRQEISRHYSIQHKDSSKTKRVTFAKRR